MCFLSSSVGRIKVVNKAFEFVAYGSSEML